MHKNFFGRLYEDKIIKCISGKRTNSIKVEELKYKGMSAKYIEIKLFSQVFIRLKEEFLKPWMGILFSLLCLSVRMCRLMSHHSVIHFYVNANAKTPPKDGVFWVPKMISVLVDMLIISCMSLLLSSICIKWEICEINAQELFWSIIRR